MQAVDPRINTDESTAARAAGTASSSLYFLQGIPNSGKPLPSTPTVTSPHTDQTNAFWLLVPRPIPDCTTPCLIPIPEKSV